MPLTQAEVARYSRHLLLTEIGVAGQERLRAARVLVVGAGGLGSPAAVYLAAAGIGTLGIVDCDRVELSNLQRQILFDTSSVGQQKALVARDRLSGLNPEIAVIAHAVELDAANVCELVDQYDVVLDGSDRVGTRYLVNDACVLRRKPLVSAAIYRFEGQAMTYLPGAGPCYRCLFPDAALAGVANCATAGVLGVLPGILGVIQATEAIKWVLGIGELLVGRLLTFDALDMAFREFSFAKRADCAVCGEHPTITVPRDRSAPETAAPAQMRRLGPLEVQACIDASAQTGSPVALIDVREPHEFAAGHLPGAHSIPLAALEDAALPTGDDVTVVFICRSGVRSAYACAIAVQRGLRQPVNLEGGLQAWAALVDPSLVVL